MQGFTWIGILTIATLAIAWVAPEALVWAAVGGCLIGTTVCVFTFTEVCFDGFELQGDATFACTALTIGALLFGAAGLGLWVLT